MKRNKLLVLLLILVCMLALLAGCGGEKDNPGTEENGWFELDGEMGILTVRIPDQTPDFAWNFVISDEKALELLTAEETDGMWVASFRALEDGEPMITFSYVKNDEINEGRILEVRCEDGKVTEIISDSIIDMTGDDTE